LQTANNLLDFRNSEQKYLDPVLTPSVVPSEVVRSQKVSTNSKLITRSGSNRSHLTSGGGSDTNSASPTIEQLSEAFSHDVEISDQKHKIQQIVNEGKIFICYNQKYAFLSMKLLIFYTESYLSPSIADSTNKYNVESILSEASTSSSDYLTSVLASELQSNSRSGCSSSLNDHFGSISCEKKPSWLLNAPAFPPPMPPDQQGSSLPVGSSPLIGGQADTSSRTILPPMIPPPPPPSTGLSSSLPSIQLVTAESTLNRKMIRLTIENDNIFEQLLSQVGSGDRIKLACALVLCNNDIKLVKNLLGSFKN
jgi:hypothetical protein